MTSQLIVELLKFGVCQKKEKKLQDMSVKSTRLTWT